MATRPFHSFISNDSCEREKIGTALAPVSLHLHQPAMQTKYESDDEEESELDIPAATNTISTQLTAEEGFGSSMSPAQRGTNTPKRTSVYTVRRISGLTLLPPLQTTSDQQQHQPQKMDGSGSRSPSSTPRTRAERPATMIFEAEEVESIYSDTPSDYGDDDNGDESCDVSDHDSDLPEGGVIDELFFVATPITYHLPKSRPNLVSISPPPSHSGRSPQLQSQPSPEEQFARAQKKQKKQQQQLGSELDFEETDASTRPTSTTGGNIRRSLNIKAKKIDTLRESTFISPEPSPMYRSSALSTTSVLSTTPPDSAKFFTHPTEPQQQQQPPSEKRRRSLIPGHLRSRRDRKSPEQSPPQTDSELQDAGNGSMGYRQQTVETPPLFNAVAWRPASPPTSPSQSDFGYTSYGTSTLPAPPKWPFNRQSTAISEPPSSPGLQRHSRTFQGPPPTHPESVPTPHSRARTRSISSIASNASKFSLPPFDSASLKAIAQKYQNRSAHSTSGTSSPTPSSLRPTTTSDSPPPRPSDCESTVSERPLSHRSQFLRTMSTTNLSMLINSHDTIDEDVVGDPLQKGYNTLGRKSKRYSSTSKSSASTASNSQHIRSKSIKWLQGTGESMSLAGNKLGSMLRKKSVAMPTIS